MSDQNVGERLAMQESKMEHVIASLDRNTQSNMELSLSLKELTIQLGYSLERTANLEGKVDDVTGRVVELERKEAVNESGKDLLKTVRNSVVVLLVGAGFTGVAFVIESYFKTK